MPFAAIIIGAILIVVAFNDTHAALATELEADIPGYFKWGAAIAAILGLGLLPGMAKPSRALLALVIVVLVVTNYQAIVDGFKEFGLSSGEAGGGEAGEAGGTATALRDGGSIATTLIGTLGGTPA